MFVAIVKSKHSGKEYESALVRETYREDGKVKARTIAKLTGLPLGAIHAVDLALRGAKPVDPKEAFVVTRSKPYGHVEAVLAAVEALGLAKLLGTVPSRERDIVLALVVTRILKPTSKIGSLRSWDDSPLLDLLGLGEVSKHEVFAALDWLEAAQDRIQKKLVQRHLALGQDALVDLSSSYFTGEKAAYAKLGYSRDGKRGTLQVNYALATNHIGCPLSIQAYPGNTIDCTTLLDQLDTLRKAGAENITLIGDRGMVSGKNIEALNAQGNHWISAVPTPALRKLIQDGFVQVGLFDDYGLASFFDPKHPGERFIVCCNPLLRDRRRHKREALLQATEAELAKVLAKVQKGKLTAPGEIGIAAGAPLKTYKVQKHFKVAISEGQLSFERNTTSISEEEALDGIYVVRTNLPEGPQATDEMVVLRYKQLIQVEQAFGSIKGELEVRPIHHRLEERIRAHLFLCMLAYYVTWHLKRAWKPLLFSDEGLPPRLEREPVAPTKSSPAGKAKKATLKREDGQVVHSWSSLLDHLETRVQNTCEVAESKVKGVSFELLTTPTQIQHEALSLAKAIQPGV